MKVKHFAFACALAAVLGLSGMAGCASGGGSGSGSSASAASSEAVPSAQDDKASLESVGVASGNVASFAFTNKIGKDIVGISIKPTSAPDYPASLLASGKKIANGTTVELYCPEIPAADAGSSAASSGVKLNALADIKVEVADGKSYELHQVNVGDVTDASIRLSGDIAYLEYKAASDGSNVSTLETEKAIAQKPAAEPAPAEPAPAEPAPAANEPAADQPAETVEVYVEEPEVYVEEEAPYDDGAAFIDDAAVGTDDEEACIPDIVLNY